MNQELIIKDPKQVVVSDRVKFYYRNREYLGYVAKKGRKYADILCDDKSEFRIPYKMLYKIPGAAQKQVQTTASRLRSQFRVNDKVRFDFRGQSLHGIISRLNPKRAYVVCESEKEYYIPYASLDRLETDPDENSAESNRSETQLAAVATLARELMANHGLNPWSFQFDNGTKRAGCCDYANQVISLSYEYVKHAGEHAIRNTILHEIAHALVGRAHHHDAVWRAKAIDLGCSGERCHDVQFTPPRYIMKCENNCWTATAERRRRGRICKKCKGEVVYLTYTQARWDKEKPHA